MKFRYLLSVVSAIAMTLLAGMAHALEISPYSDKALQQLQAAGKPVALHFHADWCPTCRAQTKAFEAMKADPALNLTLLVADYDKERDLKKQLNVRSQSTVIVFKGSKETARLGGETEAAKLKTAFLTAF